MIKIYVSLLFFFVTYCCHAQYYVDVQYYIEIEDRFVTVTDTLNTDLVTEANDLAFSIFLHAVADYDCAYLSILYSSKEEKLSLMLPFHYRIYNDDCEIEILSRYTIKRLLSRLKDDYWGQNISRLKGLDKQKKHKSKKSSNKKRPRKSRPEERKFEPVPYL